jgi:hypothetical protein
MGGGSPRTAVPGRARGRQGKREKGESGGADKWAGPRGWGPAIEREEGSEGDRWGTGR